MRYHIGSLTPNSQMNRQPRSPLVQRSLPTCTLSLANVTSSTASNNTLRNSDAMVVDPPSFSMTSLSTVESGIVPFPTTGKRTHSLLRATAYSPRLTIPISARQSDEAYSTDPDPPRKRTRTSALPSSKTRFNRANSPSNTISHLNRSTSYSSPSSATPKSTMKDAPIPSGVAQSNPLPIPSHSPPIDSPPLHSVSDATQLVPKPLICPLPSLRWRQKRPAASESRILISLHQATVYGLALRYPIEKPDIASAADTTDDMNCEIFIVVFGCKAHRLFLAGPLQSDKGGGNASLYVQDAILSQRLRNHLLANGIDAFREAFLELNSVDHAPCLPSIAHVVLAYQKLVATLIIRHRSSPTRSRASTAASNNARFQKKPSRLSAVRNLD